MSPPAGWQPTEYALRHSRVATFAATTGATSFEDVLARSIEDPAWYWDAAIRFLELPFETPYDTVCDSTRGVAWSDWFVGGALNVSAFCVDRWLPTRAEETALQFHGEDGSVRRWTWAALYAQTEGLARLLRDRGVDVGDRVAIYMPMAPEAVAAFLAVARIGAVAVPLFSGFGPEAIAVRVKNSEASAVLTMDMTLRRGKRIPMSSVVTSAIVDLAHVHTIVVASRFDDGDVTDDPRAIPWPQAASLSAAPTTVFVPSSHELLLAYTSGTTGIPKGAVHCHGGLPIKVAAEGAFQHDLGPGDRLLWFSDMGWIMGPYQIIAALANGATLCLIEGAPDHPGPDRLWNVVADAGVTVLGLSPTLVRSLMPLGEEHVRKHDLSAVRILGSTGEPWNIDAWIWYFEVVGGGGCPVINMSGGTEVGGALLSPHPVQAIPPGSLVGPALGMAADIFDGAGRPIRGEVGELVCTRSWPGMTRGLYGDPARYEETYWSRWPDTWVQGDWASTDAEGRWFLHGRSDDTIMIAGKRVGPAEPESSLVADPRVLEAAAIGAPDEIKGESLVLFVVPTDGLNATQETAAALAQRLVESLGASFRPKRVIFVDTLPKTRSGKVLRRALRALYVGDDLGDLSSMEDPSALDHIRQALADNRS